MVNPCHESRRLRKACRSQNKHKRTESLEPPTLETGPARLQPARQMRGPPPGAPLIGGDAATRRSASYVAAPSPLIGWRSRARRAQPMSGVEGGPSPRALFLTRRRRNGCVTGSHWSRL